MKVLVFAHTPPPFHGQSFMVSQLLAHVGGTDASDGETIVFLHVNARLSRGLDDIGSWRFAKLFLLAGHILEGWFLWLWYRPDVFYYVPAPAKLGALIRDWLVLILLAPLFRYRVYHWHSAGMGKWIAAAGGKQLGARLTRRLFRGHELSIVMNEYARQEVEVFEPKRIEIVSYGIPDPCPNFETALLPERRRRRKAAAAAGDGAIVPFNLLFLGLATASKGLFDSIEAVARANARLQAEGSTRRLRLTVAGTFVDAVEEARFRQRLGEKDLLVDIDGAPQAAVIYAGHVDGNFKTQLLQESDTLCFASYYPNEVQPVAIVEALAFGLPVLLSRWHGLPSMLPERLAHFANPNDPASLADALPGLLDEARFEDYRRCYLERYTIALHCRRMREVLLLLKK